MGPPLPDLLRERTAPLPTWLRAVYLAGAVLCFAAGFVGWLIPVVTGLPFYAVGLALLAAASRRARRWINRLERRLPEKLRWRLRRTLLRVGGERIRRLVQFPEEMEEPGAKPRSAGPPDPGAPASGR